MSMVLPFSMMDVTGAHAIAGVSSVVGPPVTFFHALAFVHALVFVHVVGAVSHLITYCWPY
jgi:hypothetical protein